MQSHPFFKQLAHPILCEALFDHVPDIAFFIKDMEGLYIAVNTTLANRLGFKDKHELVGKRADQVFPKPLGDGFTLQDAHILHTGAGIYGRLELHLYPNNKEGWCLTYKEPLLDGDNKVIGLAGISKDIHSFAEQRDDLAPIHKVITHIRKNMAEQLRLPELAALVDLSVYQLDQRIRSLYHMSAGQFITQTRIEKACKLLKTTKQSIAEVALDCGYSDQSAFTRQFKQTTGVTPKAYRDNFTA